MYVYRDNSGSVLQIINMLIKLAGRKPETEWMKGGFKGSSVGLPGSIVNRMPSEGYQK